MRAELAAVCVVHRVLDGYGQVGRTGIDKRPVEGRARVEAAGLVGDTQVDRRFHGGPNQALYAYAEEDAGWWSEQLGRPVTPGMFGENLRTRGIDLGAAVIGELWQIGGSDPVRVRVTKPRVPCNTFTVWMGEARWVRRFTEAGRAGVYLKVETPGWITAGDEITVLERPEHGVSALDAFRCSDAALMRRLLDADAAGEPALDVDLKGRAELCLRRGRVRETGDTKLASRG